MELLTLAVVGLGAAVGLGLFAVLSQAEEKAVVRASLRQLDDYEVESVREKELLAPIRDRAFAPLMHGLTGLGKRFTPQGYMETIRTKLTSAGKGDQELVRPVPRHPSGHRGPRADRGATSRTATRRSTASGSR